MARHRADHRRPFRTLDIPVLAIGFTLAACNGTILGGDGTAQPPTGGSGNTGDPTSPGGNNGGPPITPSSTIPEVVDPGTGKACTTNGFTPARIWRLSDEQYSAVVADLLPGVPVPTVTTPGRGRDEFLVTDTALPVSSALSSDIRVSAKAVAKAAVADVAKLTGCTTQDRACADSFVTRFAARAFRRPVSTDEKNGLLGLYDLGAKENHGEGIKLVIEAILQTPSFWYRTEVGAGSADTKLIQLTGYEMASALSFYLLNSIPDAELWQAAEDGSLLKDGGLDQQVTRLLALPRVQENLTRVHLKWVGLGDGINVDLASQFPDFTPDLKTSLEQETKLFFSDLLTKGGTLADVLTSRRGFVDQRLATHYGVTAPGGGSGFSEVTYPANQRAGIVTQAAILARYSLGHPVVLRGKYVREQLLCGAIGTPPNIPDIEEEATASANLSEREQSKRRAANGTCNACHQMMDPLGLAFVQYDNLARWKPNDKDGTPLDATGAISLTGDVDGPVLNAVDLAKKLSESKAVRLCMAQQMYTYALGRDLMADDTCELQRIDAYVEANGGKLSQLVAGIIKSAAFRYRTGGKL
jgi:hypothetical protein